MKLIKVLIIIIWLGFAPQALAQSSAPEQSTAGAQTPPKLIVTVSDETGVLVSSAQVILTQVASQIVHKGETDYAGRREFTGLNPGLYQLRVEKQGFYSVRLDEVRIGEIETVGITLNHEQEVRESIDVASSPPAIDLTNTASSGTLNSREIINIPYSTTRDFRGVLPYIPRIVRTPSGQVHINGSSATQIFSQLDGFNISHPVNGLLEIRISPDALRSIEVQGSRYSAEHGKGSGGVLSLASGMGDDRYRFTITDFVPSFQYNKGVNINGWTPRATFSGPLRKNKAWFFNATDGEYNLDIINELPSGADRNHAWRLNNLTKAQVNLNQSNILTAGFLFNLYRVDHAGLSLFSPLETTRNLSQSAYIFTIKNQSYLANGLMLEVGFGASQFNSDQLPLGRSPYVVSPEGASGNFYRSSEAMSRRLQWIANATIPPLQWRGKHEFRVGADIERIGYQHLVERRPLSVLRVDGSLTREVDFNNEPEFTTNNFLLSGYAQDRWAVSDRLLMELGLRLDRDTVVRRTLFSPRVAATYLLTRDGETKLSAGVGLYYDATNLGFITRSLEGRRFDRYYAMDGQTPLGPPLETSFQVNEDDLKAPRLLNWSVGLERKLPASIYLSVEAIEKRGVNGFAFAPRNFWPTGQMNGRYVLGNEREDHYKAVSVTVRRAFKSNYELFASYTRSSTRSNAVFDFSLDRILFSSQSAGPLAWDAPNRLISWGWLPLIKGFDLSYALDWRTGYPYSLINEEQLIVGAPNSQRLPAYFSLNLHVEKRFRFLGVNLAVRGGFNNVTDRQNPAEINNNVDSPQFLTYGGVQNRAFVGRIRFLGRK